MVSIQLTKFRSRLIRSGILVCLAVLGQPVNADPPESWLGQNTQPQQRQDLQLQASASCAATACHGGPRAGVAATGAVRGSEYPLWLESDPHARSWKTLCGDKSVKILERLQIMKDGRILDQAGFDNCLACHNSTRHFQESRTPERITEGIGCSGCHGPDQLWRAAHTSRDWSSTAALGIGFAQTKNLLARARLCASCHVGDRDRDMNHDIIAAGHPALHYEFSTYQRRQPKHWRSGATPNEDNEAYAWLVGQVASLDAFLTLLESRAAETNPVSQWPELAIFDCSSCHQQLTKETYRSPARTTTNPALSQWHRFGVQQFLNWRSQQAASSPTDLELTEALKELERALKSPGVDAQVALKASQRTRAALDRFVLSLDGQSAVNGFNASQLTSIVTMAGLDRTASGSWESAAQFYLASVAAKSQWPASPEGDDSVLNTSRRLREALQFRTDSATPKNRFRDNATFVGPESLKSHWQALQKTITLDQLPKPK